MDGGAGPGPRVAGGVELHGEGGDERDRAVVEDVQERDLAAAVSCRRSFAAPLTGARSGADSDSLQLQ